MTPEMQQYLLYAGFLLGGIVLRHFGVTLPGLPIPGINPPAPLPSSSPTSPPRSTPPNGTDLPFPPKAILDAIDARLALIEQKLTASGGSTNDSLATALASLAHRLIDKQTPPSSPTPTA